jgi:hypothetical protein
VKRPPVGRLAPPSSTDGTASRLCGRTLPRFRTAASRCRRSPAHEALRGRAARTPAQSPPRQPRPAPGTRASAAVPLIAPRRKTRRNSHRLPPTETLSRVASRHVVRPAHPLAPSRLVKEVTAARRSPDPIHLSTTFSKEIRAPLPLVARQNRARTPTAARADLRRRRRRVPRRVRADQRRAGADGTPLKGLTTTPSSCTPASALTTPARQ